MSSKQSPPVELWDVKEAAAFLRVHPEHLRRLSRAGKVPAVKVGRSWRYDPEALREWVRRGGTMQREASHDEAQDRGGA